MKKLFFLIIASKIFFLSCKDHLDSNHSDAYLNIIKKSQKTTTSGTSGTSKKRTSSKKITKKAPELQEGPLTHEQLLKRQGSALLIALRNTLRQINPIENNNIKEESISGLLAKISGVNTEIGRVSPKDLLREIQGEGSLGEIAEEIPIKQEESEDTILEPPK